MENKIRYLQLFANNSKLLERANVVHARVLRDQREESIAVDSERIPTSPLQSQSVGNKPLRSFIDVSNLSF